MLDYKSETYEPGSLRFVEQFQPEVRNKHPKYIYEVISSPDQRRIVKQVPEHMIPSEIIGSGLFRSLNLPAPIIVHRILNERNSLVMQDLSEQFVPDTSYGEGGVMTNPNLRKQFKQSLIATILTGDYDRVPWNLMYSKDMLKLMHIDFGACLGARSQGGFDGYLPIIDQTEILHALAEQDFLEQIRVKAFDDIVTLINGQLVVIDWKTIQTQLETLRQLSDDIIDSIVESVGWEYIDCHRIINEALITLERKKTQIEREVNEKRKQVEILKLQRAVATYSSMKVDYAGNIANYYKNTIKRRRDGILSYFDCNKLEG